MVAIALGPVMDHARVAHADGSGETAAAWGVATFELTAPISLGAMLAWDPEATESGRFMLYALPPLGAAITVGLVSHQQEWGPAIPLAAHGALLCGASGFLIGGLIEGYQEDRALAHGPLPYGLAGAGVLLCGWAGARTIEPGLPTQTWLTAPLVSGLAGAGIAVVPGLILKYYGRDTTANRLLGWCVAAGMTLGLLVGAVVGPDTGSDPDDDFDFDAASARASRRAATFMLPLSWSF